jgi:hypothetical protein
LIDAQGCHAFPVPCRRRYIAVTRLEEDRIELVGHHFATEALAYFLGSSGVIEMALGQEKMSYGHLFE